MKAFRDDRDVTQYYESEGDGGLRTCLASLATPSVAALFSLIPAVFRQTPQGQAALGLMGSALLSRLLERNPCVVHLPGGSATTMRAIDGSLLRSITTSETIS